MGGDMVQRLREPTALAKDPNLVSISTTPEQRKSDTLSPPLAVHTRGILTNCSKTLIHIR